MSAIFLGLIAAPTLIIAVNAWLNRRTASHAHTSPFLAGLIATMIWVPLWLWLCSRTLGTSAAEMAWCLVFGIVYAFCIVFLNWFIFTLTDVSMHIQILMQIYEHNAVSMQELTRKYNKDVILANRIPRLLMLGQLRAKNDRLYVSGRLVLLGAAMCTLLRRLLGLPTTPELADHE